MTDEWADRLAAVLAARAEVRKRRAAFRAELTRRRTAKPSATPQGQMGNVFPICRPTAYGSGGHDPAQLR
jgi:hypothetical protein